MIDYKLTALDNDFITVWSNYLLLKDINLIINEIETLAELGQINAIQCWYKFKNKGDNTKIDKSLENYKENDFEKLLAIAYSQDYDEVRKICNGACDSALCDPKYNYVKELSLLLQQCDFFKYLIDAAIETKNFENKTNPYLMGQRRLEIMSHLLKTWPISNDKLYIKKLIETQGQALKNVLNSIYQRGIEYGNPQFAFAIAKNNQMFGNTDKENERAQSLLLNLSQRELSSTLKDALYKKDQETRAEI